MRSHSPHRSRALTRGLCRTRVTVLSGLLVIGALTVSGVVSPVQAEEANPSPEAMNYEFTDYQFRVMPLSRQQCNDPDNVDGYQLGVQAYMAELGQHGVIRFKVDFQVFDQQNRLPLGVPNYHFDRSTSNFPDAPDSRFAWLPDGAFHIFGEDAPLAAGHTYVVKAKMTWIRANPRRNWTHTAKIFTCNG